MYIILSDVEALIIGIGFWGENYTKYRRGLNTEKRVFGGIFYYTYNKDPPPKKKKKKSIAIDPGPLYWPSFPRRIVVGLRMSTRRFVRGVGIFFLLSVVGLR